jgi:hypothetical protein
MDGEEILPLYPWESGTCFRHPQAGEVDTTCIAVLRPQHGDAREIRACRACVLAMECDRRRAAERAGLKYEPGRLADGDCG